MAKVYELVVKQRKADGNWTVARPKSKKPSAVRETRMEALARARELAHDGSLIFFRTSTGSLRQHHFRP
jgi:hypothetical protein